MPGERALPEELRGVHRTRAYHDVARGWDGQVGLACSGGVDSTALLLLAARAVRQRSVPEFVVLHVDHRERDDSSEDAQFVAQLCERLDIPFELLRFERRLPRALGASREAQLRDERYRVLATAARRLQLDAIVTAHTLDDQAETILMRMISGSGPLGSAGMQRRTSISTSAGTVEVERPLLGTSRADLEHVLAVAGVVPRHDPSNDSPAYRRNALRHQVMPALRAIEPGFAGALARSALLAYDDALECERLADQRFDELVISRAASRVVDRDFVREGSPAIVRRVVRRMALDLMQAGSERERELTFERVEAVRLAARHRSGAVIELPGGIAALIERRVVKVMRADAQGDGSPDATGGA